jgi:hypothetical protein
VTPKIFGFLLTGTVVLLMEISGWYLVSAVAKEKTVADDFGAKSWSFLYYIHGIRMARYSSTDLLALTMSVSLAIA